MTIPVFDDKTLSRFWSKVDKNGPLWNGTPCWIWTAASSPAGYGKFRLDGVRTSPNRKLVLAHRVSVILSGRKIPDSYVVDHLCRNPARVNPSHLEVVTFKENCLRGTSPAAIHHKKTHCVYGHEFTDENTLYYGKSRRCKECQKRNTAATNAMVSKDPERKARYRENRGDYCSRYRQDKKRKWEENPQLRDAYNARRRDRKRAKKEAMKIDS